MSESVDRPMSVPRTLIAGFGNVLRGDDGFGVEVVRRLECRGHRADVELIDVGTGGIHLAHQLLSRYDRLIVVDAMTRGGPPGSLYVLAVERVAAATELDMHVVVPARALSLARALGVLPATVYMVGCEPVQVDELTTALSPVVDAAADAAVLRIEELLGVAGESMESAAHEHGVS